MKYLIGLLLILSSSVYASGTGGSGNVSLIQNFGPAATPFAVMPFFGMTTGSGLTGATPFKVITATNSTTTGSAFNSFYDPSTGSVYLTPSGKSVEILGVCWGANISASNVNWQFGFSTGAPTEGSATPPSGPSYECGSSGAFCMPFAAAIAVQQCIPVHLVIPATAIEHIWTQAQGTNGAYQIFWQMYLREF